MSTLTKKKRKADTDQQLVRRLAKSSLDTEERMRQMMTEQLDTKQQLNGVVGALNAAVANQKQFQSSVSTKFAAVSSTVKSVESEVDTVSEKVDTVETMVDTVEAKVDDVARNMEAMQQDQESVRHREMKKSTKDKQFLAPLAALFNTKTGVIAWQPVRYTNDMGETYKVTVLCMPFFVWYHFKGRPDAKLNENATRAYMGADEGIPLHPEIPYEDFCAILWQTAFRPRVVSKTGSWKNESWNRANFLMVPSEAWKKLEQRNEKDFPNRPRTLPLIPKTKRDFAHLDNNIAYTQGAPGDLSTGHYLPFDRSFTMEEKALTPAMGQTWTKKMLDTLAIREFFGITEEERGKCHIVGGTLQTATINTHVQVHEENKVKIEAAMCRRLKRAYRKSNNGKNTSSNKRKVSL